MDAKISIPNKTSSKKKAYVKEHKNLEFQNMLIYSDNHGVTIILFF